MNVLIDIGHPAHVHLFRNFAVKMKERGHQLLFTCREKEFEIDLLKFYGFKFRSFGKKYNSYWGKLFGMVQFDIKEFFTGLSFKPDILLSHGSLYAAHASFLLRKPHVSLEDTFNFEQIRLYLPFTQVVLTGDYEHPQLGKKEIKYSGYHELAYLHPRYFMPDKGVLDSLSINNNEKYVILRFVAWAATHDYGQKGISTTNKIKAVKELEKYARVFISSEVKLPTELKRYEICIAPNKMHDALAFASLLFGESSTMAEECAFLGVPSIFLNNKSTDYTNHLEKDYGLVFNYSESEADQLNAITKAVELLQADSNLEWLNRRDKMLAGKIDVTAFLLWFVENYPLSAHKMRKEPDFQYSFR